MADKTTTTPYPDSKNNKLERMMLTENSIYDDILNGIYFSDVKYAISASNN